MTPDLQAEHRRLKALVKNATDNEKLREDVLREIAKYFIGGLRGFGLSDGALCVSAGLPGYEDYKSEVSTLQDEGRYRGLSDSLWSLLRLLGIAHETVRGIRGIGSGFEWHRFSEPWTKALQSEVWRCTSAFRATRDGIKKEKENEKVEQALQKKLAEWKAASPPPKQIGAATLSDILGQQTLLKGTPQPPASVDGCNEH